MPIDFSFLRSLSPAWEAVFFAETALLALPVQMAGSFVLISSLSKEYKHVTMQLTKRPCGAEELWRTRSGRRVGNEKNAFGIAYPLGSCLVFAV